MCVLVQDRTSTNLANISMESGGSVLFVFLTCMMSCCVIVEGQGFSVLAERWTDWMCSFRGDRRTDGPSTCRSVLQYRVTGNQHVHAARFAS